ncbi:flagellar hook protein FlgE [Phorcysia thermohydrogeniphila]|uniref:Flagellar hook protein FlgE n=1 Tax=Phorcysia thermohydrogeniphila TaxID=936138 RepID=A0A4R1G8F9_9BACT|nr:flagellar hook protein FlgE [Phorcysia thermohydrogeniphila]TCK03878.1 flagellar hook protein FlgE [Phorcysia thermohydrogeniphila]
MLQSFYTAFTGLTADKDWLSVISDNIANVNTVGYKAERAVFEDLLARSLVTFKNGAPVNKEIGGGTFISTTVKDFSQGTFMNTNNSLDLALDGEGFFMVKDEAGITYYTRNGQFRLDANGDLINMQGMKVQGWELDENGNMVGAVDSINVPMSIEPKETTSVSFEEPTNLDSRAQVVTGTFDPADATTYNYVNSITVYDSLGNSHDLSFYFRKVGSNQWEVYVYLDGSSITNSTLQFDSNGNLTSGSPITVNATLTNGANNLSITVDMSRVKQVASDFIFYAQQDGNSKGDIMSIAVSEDGVIKATYTNGEVKDIARLAIATFRDKEILVRKGSWLYMPNVQTFTPIIMPGGVISKIRSGVLEMSNVDIANEFINLITAQRSYQANARIITTDDQILQETMNIKR